MNKQANKSKLDKAINVLLAIFIIIAIIIVARMCIDAYIDYRIDTFFHENNVWYMSEEIY